MAEIGTAVTLARMLLEAPIGEIVESRTRSILGRQRVQHRINWGTQNMRGAPLPVWVDEGDLAEVPYADAPLRADRTFATVVIEDIAQAFENGEFDDAESSGEGIALAIRQRYLGAGEPRGL